MPPPQQIVVSSATTPNGQLVDKNGMATRPFLKLLQDQGRAINAALTPNGGLQPGVIPASQPVPTPLTAAVVTEVASAGSGNPLPALPVGYLDWEINGTIYKIPFYLP